MELGTKEQMNFLKGYPLLVVLVGSLIGNVYQNMAKDKIYEKWIAEKEARIITQSEVIKDYRNNAILSNQLSKAAEKINE